MVTEKDKKQTAYHEAGHAILGKLLQPDDQVHQISIIPTGRAGGYTIQRPNNDPMYSSKSEMQNEIIVLLGGRVAEDIIFGDVNTGASSDIQRATSIAKNMVTKYGMSDLLGPLVYGSNHSSDEVFLGRDFNSQRDYSESTAAMIDAEVKKIVTEGFETAKRMLTENIDKLHFISEFLIKNEIMDEYQFQAAMDGSAYTVEELETLSEQRKQQSKQENEEKAKREADERKAREEEERRRLDELLGRVDPNHRPQNPNNNDYPNPPEGSDNK